LSIGRNDSCPCGSGKKYKKCCGHHSIISLNDFIAAEAVEIQSRVTKFAISNYKTNIENYLDERLKGFNIPRDVFEAFSFLMINWFIATHPIENGKTILERFIEKHDKTLKRPRVRSIIQSWKQAKPSILIVEKSENNQLITKDLFSKEEMTVLTFNEAHHVPEGSIVIGITMPFEQQYTFYTLYLDIPFHYTSKFEQTIFNWMEDSEHSSPKSFLVGKYPEIVKLALLGDENPIQVEDITWESPLHEEVAKVFQNEIVKIENSELASQIGIALWHQYCSVEKPRIRNKGIYAGALHYIVESIITPNQMNTFKSLSEMYDANASSISQRSKQMADILQKDIREWKKKISSVENQRQAQ